MAPQDHEHFIQLCYSLAEQAVQNGDHPFAALLVRGGDTLQMAVNTVNSDNDVTHHAEINLIRNASRRLSADVLAQCTVYTSTEPCAMCTGAIYAAGITNIVFGCSAAAVYDLVGSDMSIPSRDILALGRHKVQVTGPLLEKEGMRTHRKFWD